MNITYHVPKDAYIELLADMIRKNERRPIRIITLLLLTVVQMSVVLLLCLFRLEPDQRVFFLIWSLLLAAVTVLRRCTILPRAKGTLQRLEYTGQLPEDFWKEHRLRVADQTLQLSYGAHKLSCPLHALSAIEESTHALHLYCGKTMLDIVPETAFPSREAMVQFAAKLQERSAQAEAPRQADEANADGGLHWKMEEPAFVEGQYQAYRTLYYRHRFLRPATFVRLTVSVLAVVNLMYNRAPIHVALSLVILLLANLENLSMIPALCRLRIRREVGEWKGGSAYSLSLQGSVLAFTSDRAAVRIPLAKINLCEQIGPSFLISWNSFPAVVLPEAVWKTPEGAALTQQIKSLCQGNLPR